MEGNIEDQLEVRAKPKWGWGQRERKQKMEKQRESERESLLRKTIKIVKVRVS